MVLYLYIVSLPIKDFFHKEAANSDFKQGQHCLRPQYTTPESQTWSHMKPIILFRSFILSYINSSTVFLDSFSQGDCKRSVIPTFPFEFPFSHEPHCGHKSNLVAPGNMPPSSSFLLDFIIGCLATQLAANQPIRCHTNTFIVRMVYYTGF